VLAGVTLSVNAFECWHARGPTGLARLAKDLIILCTCIVGLWGTHLFFQSESAERNLLSTVTVFQRHGANVTDLCRNSVAEQNRTDTVTDSCLMAN